MEKEIKKITKEEAKNAINRLILYIRQFDFSCNEIVCEHYYNLLDFEKWLLEEQK